MMAFVAARQRTRQEFEVLLRQGGFVLDREIETDAGIAILESTST
jgi:hypothetical protein